MSKLYLPLLVILAAVALVWLLLLCPRRNEPGWEKFSGVRYAHRGLHDITRGVPENSIPAFRLAAEKGFGAELDVHLLSDGNLAVVHDSLLQRLCGADVRVENLTAADLDKYPLQGTEEIIPLLPQVLEIFTGKAPLIVELKVEGGNAAALTDATMAVLEQWGGDFCVESFHPAAVGYLKKHYPQVIRGQLAQNFFAGSETGGLSRPLAFAMTFLLTTFLTRPDFIAYKHTDRKNISLRLMRWLYGVHEVSWTVRDEAQLLEPEQAGCVTIFENFIPT